MRTRASCRPALGAPRGTPGKRGRAAASAASWARSTRVRRSKSWRRSVSGSTRSSSRTTGRRGVVTLPPAQGRARARRDAPAARARPRGAGRARHAALARSGSSAGGSTGSSTPAPGPCPPPSGGGSGRSTKRGAVPRARRSDAIHRRPLRAIDAVVDVDAVDPDLHRGSLSSARRHGGATPARRAPPRNRRRTSRPCAADPRARPCPCAGNSCRRRRAGRGP